MQVTKTRAQAQAEAAERAKANEGCNICPECGEDWPVSELYMETPPRTTQGIEQCHTRTFVRMIGGYWAVDCFRCRTCGAEWEGEPYKVDRNY